MKLIEEIQSRLEICAKATPGPWEMHVSLARVELFMGIHTFRSPTFDYMRSLERAEKDGTFCVQSRNQREGELAALRVAAEALECETPAICAISACPCDNCEALAQIASLLGPQDKLLSEGK